METSQGTKATAATNNLFNSGDFMSLCYSQVTPHSPEPTGSHILPIL
jgi:hypothetical protein